MILSLFFSLLLLLHLPACAFTNPNHRPLKTVDSRGRRFLLHSHFGEIRRLQLGIPTYNQLLLRVWIIYGSDDGRGASTARESTLIFLCLFPKTATSRDREKLRALFHTAGILNLLRGRRCLSVTTSRRYNLSSPEEVGIVGASPGWKVEVS